jgi:hypothetical protein
MSLRARQQAATPAFMAGTDVNAFASLHLSVQELNEALLTHGSAAEWRRGVLCPCARIETGVAAVSCKQCRGVGFLYPASMREPLIVLDTSRSSTLKWAQAGLMAEGTVMFTFPCGALPGNGDLVLPDNDVHIVQEHLWRDRTLRVRDSQLREDRDRMIAAQRKRPLRGRTERLLYPTDVCVEVAYYLDAQDELVLAQEGIHYKLGPENTWEWLDSWGPPSGQAVSVRYRAPAAYMVEGSVPRLRSENSEAMPYVVTAKRLDRISADDLR